MANSEKEKAKSMVKELGKEKAKDKLVKLIQFNVDNSQKSGDLHDNFRQYWSNVLKHI